MSLLIDDKPINWDFIGENAKRDFAKPHTWTVAPEKVIFDWINNRWQTPNLFISTQYFATFAYGINEPRMKHKVEYEEGKIPHPGNPNLTLRQPQMVSIIDGYEKDMTDVEKNFFYFYHPGRVDGIAYDKKHPRKIFLYDAESVSKKQETDAEIIMNVLQKVIGLSVERPHEIIAMAKTLTATAPLNVTGSIRMDEALMMAATTQENADLKRRHLAQLKNNLFTFTQNNAKFVRNMLQERDSDLYSLIERARASNMLIFEKDSSVANFQGKWAFAQGKKRVELCVVTIDERPLKRLYDFLTDPKPDEKVKSGNAHELLQKSMGEVLA